MTTETSTTSRPALRQIGRVLIPGLVACAAILQLYAAPQKARGPLSKGEVVDLLKSGVTPPRVQELVTKYGISFQITPQVQSDLRGAGATDRLLETLRQLAPVLPKQPPPPSIGSILVTTVPRGAEVSVDNNPPEKSDDQGRLLFAQLAPGAHDIRITAAGYSNYEAKVGVVAGQTTAASITLAQVAVAVEHFQVTHKHLIGQTRGELTIGDGHVRFQADKGNDAFDFPISSIAKYGQVEIGADFYFQLNTGHSYYFYGPAAVVSAITQAKEQH